MTFTTTLNEIRAHSPCASGWSKLLETLGKTKADDEPLSLLTILDSNGLDDALWCTQAFKGHDRDFRLFAVWAARQVQHLMIDSRSLDALEVAERFAEGLANPDQLDAARDAAWDAAWDARGDAAWAAAWVAGGVAGGDAAWAAARGAAWVAGGDAGGDAQEKRLRQMINDGQWVGGTQP